MQAQLRYTLFAGVNGAGKSTLFRSDLWDSSTITPTTPRVNSDEILLASGWDWTDSTAQLRAGKEALRIVKTCLEQRVSFNQETTLTGRTIMRFIAQAKELGFYITLYYVGIEDPEIANRRIAYRVTQGGHGIDPDTVRRRAKASFDNLVQAVPLCDEVFLFDNTYLLKPMARFFAGDLVSYENQSIDVTWIHEIMMRLIANSET
ncbi:MULTISPECIES: hypothetical protein [Gordonibacter]|uniref:UDP-N-acetylglucosamine kinase n=1 Tax=Gordonibacter faecis TaxID=3047475 RepID=A0ABT7DMW2_9ACTN|nr:MULTISPECIES: hypothetical protein [unclassified Gordonibacter]MDJ1650874.1 hypothetical protein [Gordonibacter sp. KGMB12511]HIW76130.1 hypothetical protein [Candidatus Gordonibacter avicola]